MFSLVANVFICFSRNSKIRDENSLTLDLRVFPSLRFHNCSEHNPGKDIFRSNRGSIDEEKAGSKACWDDSHMAVPDWECLLEASIIARLPGHICPGGGCHHMDIGGGVGACACSVEKQWEECCLKHTLDTEQPYSLDTVHSSQINLL